MRRPLPSVLSPTDRVVLFDGVCNFCSGAVRFLIPRDPQGTLKMCSLQSEAGQAILTWARLPLDDFDTMVFVEDGRVYTKTTGVLRLMRFLRWPWPLLALLMVVPAPVRDWAYDRLALNRYSLFGKGEACMMPTPDIARRFLS